MAKILAVGIATLDIINTVASYPPEDAEVRALSQRCCRGGNATNTLVVLSQLGHICHWAGVLVDEPDGHHIEADLARYHINTHSVKRLATGKVPTSYITHNQHTGSRTIVHYRDLPEYDFASFQTLDLSPFDWLHFEGRHISDTLKMLQWTRQHYPSLTISLEIEKNREGILALLPWVDVVMFSKPFAQAQGYQHAHDFLLAMAVHAPQAHLSCTWGEAGAWLWEPAPLLHHSPAYPPAQLRDTLAAGDTYNAGLIDSLCRQRPIATALSNACRLAGYKCGQIGLTLDSLPDDTLQN